MSFVLLFLGAVAVGALAQIWKRRTGALWAILTFCLALPWYLIAEFSLSLPAFQAENADHAPEAIAAARILVSVGIPIIVMALAVCTLPKRRHENA